MSAKVVLERVEQGDQGTFGRWRTPTFTLYTGELPDRQNHATSSRIPVGLYNVIWSWSDHFRRMMYLVLDVEARAGIRLHSANFMGDDALGLRKQLNGCIALGERIGVMGGQKALILSAPAVRRFEDYMGQQPFTLEIR